MSVAVVHVVDDDAAIRDSLKWLIESVGLQVKTYASAHTFLQHQRLGKVLSLGCLLLDVRLRDMNGLALLERLQQGAFQLPVIMISGHGDVPMAVRAMKAGALDFVQKPFNDQPLLELLQAAILLSEEQLKVRERLEDLQAHFEQLSPRERQVMEKVVEGQTNREIAAQLGLSHKTVEAHRSKVMEKMAVDSLPQLVKCSLALQGKNEA
ncbi:MAG: response regulator [Gammaproteobacteria bacterium]|nr:response regulator [Gammaproteobacteria bacterium]